MELQNRYRWIAKRPDGSEFSTGESLSGIMMLSFVPDMPLFPRHDFSGIPMVRRFARGFLRGFGGGMKEYLHCVVCQGFRIYLRSSDGGVLMTPEDYEVYL